MKQDLVGFYNASRVRASVVSDEPNRVKVKSETFASGFGFDDQRQVECIDGVVDLVGDDQPSFDEHHSEAAAECEATITVFFRRYEQQLVQLFGM